MPLEGILKKLLVLLWLSCALLGVELPREEGLAIYHLENGVQVWLKPQAVAGESVSCRVVAKHPRAGLPQVFSMDLPLDVFEDEFFGLIDHCKETLGFEEEYNLTVVVVGGFDPQQLASFLSEACNAFASRRPPSPLQPVNIVTSAQVDKIEVGVYYPHVLHELKTDQDIRSEWVTYLVQAMVQERVQKAVHEAGGEWVASPDVKVLLAATHTVIHGRQISGQEPVFLLAKCLGAFQEIKRGGFSDVELSSAKALLQKRLLLFYPRQLTNPILADYLASLAAREAGSPDYTLFMTLSLRILAEIDMQQVVEMLGASFKDEERIVRITTPLSVDLSEASLLVYVDQFKADDIALTAPQEGQDAFIQLPLDEVKTKLITELISTVGHSHWTYLGLPHIQSKLLQIGRDIQHVHPLRFLGVVFADPDLRKAMRGIYASGLKWKSFLYGSHNQTGFSHKMDREWERNNLTPYLWGFSQYVKKHPDQISPYFERKDWIGLVEYLMELK